MRQNHENTIPLVYNNDLAREATTSLVSMANSGSFSLNAPSDNPGENTFHLFIPAMATVKPSIAEAVSAW